MLSINTTSLLSKALVMISFTGAFGVAQAAGPTGPVKILSVRPGLNASDIISVTKSCARETGISIAKQVYAVKDSKWFDNNLILNDYDQPFHILDAKVRVAQPEWMIGNKADNQESTIPYLGVSIDHIDSKYSAEKLFNKEATLFSFTKGSADIHGVANQHFETEAFYLSKLVSGIDSNAHPQLIEVPQLVYKVQSGLTSYDFNGTSTTPKSKLFIESVWS